jgi:1,2-diacylglycerol 3-beta-glucosyltransferase
MLIIHLLLLLPIAFLGFFSAYQFGFLLVRLAGFILPARKKVFSSAAPQSTRFVVVVPAHNEELLIGQTVGSILKARYPAGNLKLVVIADNCSDGTAKIAREHGATCLERFDEVKRGKPYALDWVIQQLDLDAHDALVIIDADTAIHEDFLTAMDARLRSGDRVLQGYFGVLNPNTTWLTRLSVLPGTLKFRVHYAAKEMLRLSCPLAGNGMCFHIDVIKKYGWKAYSLTENWEYWAMLTQEGIRTASAPEAHIYSQAAESLQSGQSQRMRWTKGRIGVLRGYGPALLLDSLRKFSPMRLDAAVELVRPAHASLMVWSVLLLVATVPLAAWDAQFLWAAIVAAAVLASQVIYLLAGLAIDKPPLSTWFALAMVPWYLLWKLIVSTKAVLTMRDRTWIRTKRHEL